MIILMYQTCAINSGASVGDGETREITLQNGIYDTLYASKAIPDDPMEDPIPDVSDWDFKTILNAPFRGNLTGGNIPFLSSMVKKIRLKRAEKDSFKWLTLTEKTITSFDDFKVDWNDRFARGNTEYKYAVVPVWSGEQGTAEDAEGGYIINTIFHNFDGLWFCDADYQYQAIFDISISTTFHQQTSVVSTWNNPIPFVNRYSKMNYQSLSIGCSFIQFIEKGCEFRLNDGVNYRSAIESFLMNGMPKIVKHQDGRIWLGMITDEMTRDDGDWSLLPTYSINFVETGKHDNQEDLVNGRFLEV